MEPDFGGYATKAGLRCSDGRIIQASAFQHMDGQKVPLVWHHGHNDAKNVLGHMMLEVRPDGVYGRGYFNNSPDAQAAKMAVQHGDIDALSIFARGVKEINKVVSHGNIHEVSLVLSGANPGARIDHVRIQHSADPDDVTDIDDEFIISRFGGDGGLDVDLKHEDTPPADTTVVEEPAEDVVEHAEDDELTVQQIIDTMDDKQRTALLYVSGLALQNKTSPDDGVAEHSNTEEGDLAHQEGSTDMSRNLFEQNGVKAIAGTDGGGTTTISHSDVEAIFADGKKRGSFKEAVKDYVIEHGITNIEVLFPDAQAISNTPEFDKRRTEWVSAVLAETRKTPFAKIKTLTADLTQDEARAKGYIKGNYKVEEWIGVTKRSTSPTTIYKKQKLDRDDILDITDFDVVSWLMAEMRLMLEEELARAVLIGDGRNPSDTDKIKDPLGASDGTGIRSILNDHEVYVTTLTVNVADANSSYEEVIDAVMDGMEYYKGTGTPTFYTTVRTLNKFKKAKDGQGRRYYKTNADVAEALGVSRIVTVEPMNEVSGLIGIIVNLADYNLGTNKGGEITSFEDFDIDYNQEKYLLETRLSGALVRVKTALVIKETAAANVLAAPVKPAFNATTGVITIPTTTGVVYKDSDGTTTLTAGPLTALAAGVEKTIYSQAASGYYFADTVNDSWRFKRPAA